MRYIAAAQTYIRNPLNELLGTPANVRLLRLLAAEVSEAISAPYAAEYSGLTEAGARRALGRLVETGFVERFGSGRAQQFRLRRGDPLATHLVALFRAEQDRYHSLISQLRELFKDFPEVSASWIDDPPIAVAQPLHIGVLAGSNALSYLADELRRRIVRIESEFELIIELHTFSPADMPDVDWSTATLLAGAPALPPYTQSFRTHAELDARATRVSKAIAELLDRNPALLKRAERHVDYLIEQEQGASLHDIREWKDILTSYSRERLKRFLIADTPRAQRLRQSSPFFAALSPQEREELLDAVEQHDS